ncbi:VanZ family protein [Comamonas terrae]|uniref:VanZ family protein n=1 Tax=Comamonas terrae TaxID=673548 RepID=A0ABW5UKB2_9BURK|nr:VanZ family protein [Comamonas terrae]
MNSIVPAAAQSRLWRVGAACSLAWALFVLWGCLNETGASGGLVLRLFPFLQGLGYMDKLVHAGLHGVLATLLWWTGSLRARSRGRAWSAAHAASVVLLCAAYGGLIEILQAMFTATRGAEWLDALANATGAGLAALLWQLLASRQPAK